jgi:hypothetical protein
MNKSPKYVPVPVPVRNLNAKQLLPYFQRCGYGSSYVLQNISLFGNRNAAFAGFAQIPFDTRSACFTALDVTTTPEKDAIACREIGAPLTFLCYQGDLLWWSQTDNNPYQIESIPASHLDGFFREHQDDFAPLAIYRAKTLGRFRKDYQKDFVDLGLMPLIEREAGEKIQRLLLNSMLQVRDDLGWRQPDPKQSQWLVKSIFWLLGAKMLHDKKVDNFIRLNFANVDEVFERVARHYGDSADGFISSQVKRTALEAVSKIIDASPSLQLATTEALAYVYENTLISKEVRAEFGTHSTPSYLVDYIIGRLEPWIRNIDEDKRSVFEPGCGHGSFLISATRLLTSLLPTAKAEPEARKRYLRERVQGYDIDDFAVEIARLSLTLTDIPNSNGWMIKQADLFESGVIEKAAAESTILLANPPFEDFTPTQRAAYARKGHKPQFVNKTAEMLARALAALPNGGVFGVVVSENFLYSDNSKPLRQRLAAEFEFEEICQFPDRVFNFAKKESAILIGRKKIGGVSSNHSMNHCRVRVRGMEGFRLRYELSHKTNVPQTRFIENNKWDFRVPELEHIWNLDVGLSVFKSMADIGNGFIHLGQNNPKLLRETILVSDKKFPDATRGYVRFKRDIQTHGLPDEVWVNLNPDVIFRPRSGIQVGIPQILINFAPVQNAPWCLKALKDENGHPVNSRFLTVRPKNKGATLEMLWALCNSPYANAYAFTHSTKREILAGTLREMPVPNFSQADVTAITAAVRAYFKAVKEHVSPTNLILGDNVRENELHNLRTLQWRIDAAILQLYELPVQLERELLDFLSGWKRVGVPFKQDCYFSENFDEPIRLADYLAITVDWDATNQRRLGLVEKMLGKIIQAGECVELEHLQYLAGVKTELLSSPPLKELRKIEMDLRKRGLWKGA